MTDELGTNLEEAPIKVTKGRKHAPEAPAALNTVRILLEENDDIPPTGLFVGVNGKGYLIPTGVEVNVPRSVLEVLDHAITSTPTVDPQTRQVIGYRDRLRYPYRLVAA